MMQKLIETCRLAFWGQRCYLDPNKKIIFSDPQIKILGLDTTGMVELPHYSTAFVRKEYVESVKNKTYQTKFAYEKYNLGNPSYKFTLTDGNSELEGEYIHFSHWFCEDCRLEEDFGDYFDSYTEPIVVAWLKRNVWFEKCLQKPFNN